MKNILFATTALVATAGIASADVSLSGAANVGVINNGTDAAQSQMYQNISLTATGAGETDNGLTFGASLTMRSGDDVDLDAGDLGDNDATNSGSITALSDYSYGNIYVSGAFGKLTLDRGGIDNLMDDGSESHDMQYDYSVGDLSVSLTAAANASSSNDGLGDQWSAKVGYAMNGVTLTVATDDESESDTTIAYAVNEMITASVNYDTDGQTTSETTVKVAYAAGDMTAHVAWADDDDDAWEVGAGYTTGALTVGATVAENDGTTAADTEYDITASYDLGGGMSLKAATNEAGAYFVGTALAF